MTMDMFGIVKQINNFFNLYFESHRQAGRTTFMVENLNEGDHVVFTNKQEADRVRKMCLRKRKIRIHCHVIPPDAPFTGNMESLMGLERVVFDHDWLESAYLIAIGRVNGVISRYTDIY